MSVRVDGATEVCDLRREFLRRSSSTGGFFFSVNRLDKVNWVQNVQGWEKVATRQITAGSLPSMIRNGCLPKDLLLGQEDGIDPWDVLKNTSPYPDRYLVLNNSYLVLDQLGRSLASAEIRRLSDSGLIAPFVPDVLEDWHTGVAVPLLIY